MSFSPQNWVKWLYKMLYNITKWYKAEKRMLNSMKTTSYGVKYVIYCIILHFIMLYNIKKVYIM